MFFIYSLSKNGDSGDPLSIVYYAFWITGTVLGYYKKT